MKKMTNFVLASAVTLALSNTAAHAECAGGLTASNPAGAYTDHGDGTITDTRTGLMWKQCAEGLSGENCATGELTPFEWEAALVHAEQHTFAGYDDWRLPNIKELRSLVEECRIDPAINSTIFPETPHAALADFFWSSSPNVGKWGDWWSWSVRFHDGAALMETLRTDEHHVRLVRGGPSAITVPNPPTGITVTVGNGQATVSWSPPINTGGAPITGYTVTSDPENRTCTPAEGQTTCTVTGLTNGTSYTFTVTATNSAGTSVASVASSTVTPTAPPPEPEPEPTPEPDPASIPLVVDTPGGVIEPLPGQEVRLQGSNIENTEIHLPSGGQVGIAIGEFMIYVTGEESAQFRVRILTINGQRFPVLTLINGSVRISANEPGQMLLAVGERLVPLFVGTSDTQMYARQTEEGQILINVIEGHIYFSNRPIERAITETEEGTSILKGETVGFDAQGNVLYIRLGSVSRKGLQTGDAENSPVLHGFRMETGATRLSGISVRTGEEPAQALKRALQRHGITQRGNPNAWGALTLAMGQALFAMQAIYEIKIETNNTEARLEALGNGDFRLTEGPMTFTIAPTFHNPEELAALLRTLGAVLTVQQDATGLLNLGGHVFAVQAGYEVLGNRTPGLEADEDTGYLIWTDSQGRGQWLFPASADFKAVEVLLKGIDPGWTLRGNGDGNLTLTAETGEFTLLPDYALVDVPEDKANEAFWFGEDGRLFVRYPKLNKAQGFVVR